MRSSAERPRMRSMQRGFIGPIGDDIPSLVPLLFGLLVFFATFSFALGAFTQKNRDFAADRESLEIANTLKSDSYIGSVKEFNALCNAVRGKSVRFSAGIMELPSTGSSALVLESLPSEYFY